MNLRLVVTGATGFIGQAVIRQLTHQENTSTEISALLRSPAQLASERGLTQIIGALPAVPALLMPGAPYVLVHLGLKQIDRDGSGFHQTNVAGTTALMQALTPDCRGIIFGSSAGVYGRGAQAGIDESRAVRPETDLTRSLVEAERIISAAAAARHISAYLLRPRLVLGRGDRFILPGVIKMFQRGLAVGRPDPRYTIIDVDDYATIIMHLAKSMANANDQVAATQRALNVGYTQPIAQSQMRALASRQFPMSATTRTIPVHPKLMGILDALPIAAAHSAVSKLMLIGLDHWFATEHLASIVGRDIIAKSPLDAYATALKHYKEDS